MSSRTEIRPFGPWASLWACTIHLRIPFQISLCPLYLWGCLLATPARPGLQSLAGFVALHFFLYPGVTGFNTVFDRDLGPVAGILRPPCPPRALLPAAIWLQALGLVVALGVTPAFAAIYFIMAVLAAAYSLPGIRWKANPLASSVVVFLGQGVLAPLGGLVATTGQWSGNRTQAVIAGLLASGFTTLGLYPLLQVFQVEEDRARGDRTLAVVLGTIRTLQYGIVVLILGGLFGQAAFARILSWQDSVLLLFAYIAAAWLINGLVRRLYNSLLSREEIWRRALRVHTIVSAAFGLYLIVRLI